MGHGTWTNVSYDALSTSKGYNKALRASDVFTRKEESRLMSPYGVQVRESRDSAEHPESLPVIIMLDETGSMGKIPFNFVKEGMPHLMLGLMDAGIQHPQILFGAIGDHLTGEAAPLQIGQFESETQLMDKWLSDVYLVGAGGPNNCESYLLAHYFAGEMTSIDSFEKRQEKGFLFTIGDEKTHDSVTGDYLRNLIGPGQYKDVYSAKDLLAKAQEKYHVFHIHANEGSYRDNQEVLSSWRSLLGDNLIIVNDHREIAKTIAETVARVHSIGPANATVTTAYAEGARVDEML